MPQVKNCAGVRLLHTFSAGDHVYRLRESLWWRVESQQTLVEYGHSVELTES